MPSSKPSSVLYVEDAPPEKCLEAAPSLEQVYLESGLNEDDAHFLANFPDEKRKKCVRKVRPDTWIERVESNLSDRLASLPSVGVPVSCVLYRQSEYWWVFLSIAL